MMLGCIVLMAVGMIMVTTIDKTTGNGLAMLSAWRVVTGLGGLGDFAMAKKCWIEKVKRKPKFKVRAYYRCQRCGRSRGTLAKFRLCRICFRELALQGQIPGVVKSSW